MKDNLVKDEGTKEVKKLDKGKILAWLSSALRRKGYEIMKGYVIEVGDVRHKVDLVAIHAPVNDVRITLGFIVKEDGLSVEDVEKFVTWKRESGFDKLAIVTLGNVDVDAYELALKFGLNIVKIGMDTAIKLDAMFGRYSVIHYEAKVPLSEAIEKIRGSLHSFLLRRRKQLLGSITAFVPLIAIEAELRFYAPEEGSVTSEELVLTFDGIRGFLTVEEAGTIKVLRELGSFCDLSENAIEVLKLISRDGAKLIGEISEVLNISEPKVKSLANMLMARSLVDIYADIIELRKTILGNSFDPRKLVRSYGLEPHEGPPPERPGQIIIYPKVQIERLLDVIEGMSGKPKAVTIIYYPVHVGLVEERESSIKKSKKFIVIDAITATESPGLEDLLVDIEEKLEVAIKESLTHKTKSGKD